MEQELAERETDRHSAARGYRTVKARAKCGVDVGDKPPQWIKVRFKKNEFPSLINTLTQFPCIKRDVLDRGQVLERAR